MPSAPCWRPASNRTPAILARFTVFRGLALESSWPFAPSKGERGPDKTGFIAADGGKIRRANSARATRSSSRSEAFLPCSQSPPARGRSFRVLARQSTNAAVFAAYHAGSTRYPAAASPSLFALMRASIHQRMVVQHHSSCACAISAAKRR